MTLFYTYTFLKIYYFWAMLEHSVHNFKKIYTFRSWLYGYDWLKMNNGGEKKFMYNK